MINICLDDLELILKEHTILKKDSARAKFVSNINPVSFPLMGW